ncbi:MAG: orotidine 5'-phosphate decarboxylase [Candidatus Nomurabacteria bacterium]|jgi:orotidine-5'-phosphate decarboxylase|nr:orotidine 5'-phosphate decarboxylase [Candidatus Nomurabacteria bacterium]
MSNILSPKDRIVVALDYKDPNDAKAVIDQLTAGTFFKIGMQLLFDVDPVTGVSQGFALAHYAKARGSKLFIDVKFGKDTPETIRGAAYNLCKIADFITVHARSGVDYLKNVQEGIASYAADNPDMPVPTVLVVVILTSETEESLHSQGYTGTYDEIFDGFFRIAIEAGLSNFISPANQIAKIRTKLDKLGKDGVIISPGMKLTGGKANIGQVSTGTFRGAIAAGADYAVAGSGIKPERSGLPSFQDGLDAAVEEVRQGLADLGGDKR